LKRNQPPVLRDTKEKDGYGWLFPNMVRTSLLTGDYSLEGFYENNRFVVERKATPGELYNNFFQKDKWIAFQAELTRLEAFQHSFVICEFTYSQLATFPDSANLHPSIKQRLRVPGSVFVRRLLEIQLKYKTRFLFAGEGFGRSMFESLSQRITEKYP
jgi:hypothetical protein